MNAGARIATAVNVGLDDYFAELGGEPAAGLYDMVIRAAEKPLLENVLQRAHGNQSHAAALLGINRNTLRTLIRKHAITVPTRLVAVDPASGFHRRPFSFETP